MFAKSAADDDNGTRRMAFPSRAFRPSGSAAFKSAPIHPAEMALAAVLAAWVVFVSWAFGTMHVWAQFTAMALAGLAFALAVFPRRIPDTLTIAQPVRVLVRLPLFWLGLALLGYVALQASNPAWVWRQDDKVWWLERRDALTWLPAGIDAPLDRMSTWRVLVIWASPFLAVTAAWLGLTRRRTVQFLTVLFVVNATAIALLGIVQKVSGTNKIFWEYAFKAEVFGTFIYRNHGAAYLLLGIAVALGLGIRHYLHGEARGARSTPAPVFAFLAVLLAAGVVVSTSRLGAVFGSGLMVLLLGVFATQLLRSGLARRTLPIFAAIAVTGFGGWALSQVDLERFFQRFSELTDGEGEASLHIRVSAAEMAREMWVDHPWLGIGAGGYRHLEALYSPRVPVLPREITFTDRNRHHVSRYWTHDAHNDHLQLLAELGLAGGLLAYGLLAGGLAALTARHRRSNSLVYAVLLATMTLLVLAVFDFPFLNPAILGSLALLIPLACRWADLEPTSAG